ncbi:hypothetical protein [Rhodococcus sp. USK10]|uniref:hypothetical protein n=1 Tax=Rhodococcus sp. USK10 TaxID=2789739 RepID=UPI0035B53A96
MSVERARTRTEAFVAGALSEGARVACGGRMPDGISRGYYYEPTSDAAAEVVEPGRSVAGLANDQHWRPGSDNAQGPRNGALAGRRPSGKGRQRSRMFSGMPQAY